MNKFRIISYIKWPDGTFNAPYDFKLNKGDYTKIVEFYNLLVKKYCDMHNYQFEFKEIDNNDLIDIEEQLIDDWRILDDTTMDIKTTQIVLYKIKYVKEVLERNEDEYVAFFDADALPSNPNIKLEEFIDDEHEMFIPPGNKYMDYISAANIFAPTLVEIFNNKDHNLDILCNQPPLLVEKIQNEKHIDILEKIHEFEKLFTGFNQGLFIVKNTPKMKKLFSLMCDNYKISLYPYPQHNNDGNLFWFFMTSKYFYSTLKYMKFSSMGHHLGYGPYLYNEETTFLLHDSDIISMKDRTKLFEIMIHNKWWTDIINDKEDNSYLLILKYETFKNTYDFIEKIKDFIEKNKNKKVYLTLDIFYVKQKYDEFLNSINIFNFNIWNDEHVNKIFYI